MPMMAPFNLMQKAQLLFKGFPSPSSTALNIPWDFMLWPTAGPGAAHLFLEAPCYRSWPQGRQSVRGSL